MDKGTPLRAVDRVQLITVCELSSYGYFFDLLSSIIAITNIANIIVKDSASYVLIATIPFP